MFLRARDGLRRPPGSRSLLVVAHVVACLTVLSGCGDGASGGSDGVGGGAHRPDGGMGGAATAVGGAGGHATGTGAGGTPGAGGAQPDAGSADARDAAVDAAVEVSLGGDAHDAADGARDAASDAGPPSVGVVAAGVRWFGRIDTTNPAAPRFSWSGNGFAARFSGTGLAAQINNSAAFVFKTVVDGQPQPTFVTTGGSATYPLAAGLPAGTHTVELYRQTEGSQGGSQLLGLTVTGGALLPPPPAPGRLIEIVGDSISCGYGTLGALADANCFASESHWDTYGAVTARALGADLSTIAISGQGVYLNYGGDMNNTLPMVYTRALTNDAAPVWDFRTQPQAVIINLGTNDISNNKGDPGAGFLQAYLGLTQTIRARYPAALIVCIIGPLLGGTDLATIRGYIATAVAMRNAAGDARIEFFDMLSTQTADKAACAYHPNPTENQLVSAQLVPELRARLGW
jgi:lysophospholipase L1-like esterase